MVGGISGTIPSWSLGHALGPASWFPLCSSRTNNSPIPVSSVGSAPPGCSTPELPVNFPGAAPKQPHPRPRSAPKRPEAQNEVQDRGTREEARSEGPILKCSKPCRAGKSCDAGETTLMHSAWKTWWHCRQRTMLSALNVSRQTMLCRARGVQAIISMSIRGKVGEERLAIQRTGRAGREAANLPSGPPEDC